MRRSSTPNFSICCGPFGIASPSSSSNSELSRVVLSRALAICRGARHFPPMLARGLPLRRGNQERRVSGARVFRLPTRARRRARLQRMNAHAQVAGSDRHSRGLRDAVHGAAGAPSPRPSLRAGGRAILPYKELRDPSLSTREAMRAVISRARDRNEPAYIFVNNRLEGNAPRSIQAVLSDPG